MSERRNRLEACAYCRLAWDILPERYQRAIEQAEKYADGLVDKSCLLEGATLLPGGDEDHLPSLLAVVWASNLNPEDVRLDYSRHYIKTEGGDTNLVDRDFDNWALKSFRDRPFSARSKEIALEAYGKRDRFGRLDPACLLVLADSLEEEMKDDYIVLHLRKGSHWRGCWAIDLVLGKN